MSDINHYKYKFHKKAVKLILSLLHIEKDKMTKSTQQNHDMSVAVSLMIVAFVMAMAFTAGFLPHPHESERYKCIESCETNLNTTCHYTGHFASREELLDNGEKVLVASHPIVELYSDKNVSDVWIISKVHNKWVLYPKNNLTNLFDYYYYLPEHVTNYTSECVWAERPYRTCYGYCSMIDLSHGGSPFARV